MAQRTGVMPAGATLRPSLPLGAVVLETSPRGPVIAVDLRYPYGYLPLTMQLVAPTLWQPASLTPAQVARSWKHLRRLRPWPRGAHVDVAVLPSCMRITSLARRPPGCGRHARFFFDNRVLSSPALP